VDPRRIIGSGITASAIVHLSFLVLVIFFSEVHPFSPVTAEPISVDIVTPNEVKSDPPPPSKSEDSSAFDVPGKPADPSPADPSPAANPVEASPAATQPPSQQAQSDPPPAADVGQQATAPTPQPQPAQQPSLAASQQAYVPAQPDLSVKYHVMLGLPQANPGDGFDAVAIQKADIASGPVVEFRRHLRTCSMLPKSVSPSDKVAVKLRVFMTPDGRLAAPPVLIEASASAKGPALMHSAMSALQACQPYAMLPADKYREWKVLDLNFTPEDFINAS
jgi:hypothetical protein